MVSVGLHTTHTYLHGYFCSTLRSIYASDEKSTMLAVSSLEAVVWRSDKIISVQLNVETSARRATEMEERVGNQVGKRTDTNTRLTVMMRGMRDAKARGQSQG